MGPEPETKGKAKMDNTAQFLIALGCKEWEHPKTHAIRIYVFAFLIMGLNIYRSSFFTALGNGKISAV